MAKTTEISTCPICNQDRYVTWEYKGQSYSKCMRPSCEGHSQVQKQFESGHFNISQQMLENQQELLTGEFKETWGLTVETCKLVGILCQENRHIFQYSETAQKVRFPLSNGDKRFEWHGYTKGIGLFGEHLKYDYSKEIIITEGEKDCATCIQEGYQAYSPNSGAESGEREISEKIDLLTQFSSIMLWIDKDKAGKRFLNKILELEGFPTYKTKIIECLECKDANECFNKHKDIFLQNIKDAKDFVPEGIKFGDQIDFSELEKPEEPGIPFPFEKMQEYFHGLRDGEVLLLGAGSGAGKSLFAKIMMMYWIKYNPTLRISCLFLEEQQKFTLKSLLALDFKLPAYKLVENPPVGLAQRGKELLGKKYYGFDDHFGSLESKKLFMKLRYLAKKSDVIILDHISIVVSGMDSVEGERKDIDKLMTTIKTIAIDTGCRFVIISHLRRPDGEKSYENGLPISSNSFRGSGSLYQLSNSVIGIERNQHSDTEKNKVTFRGLKNRFKGDTGVLDIVYYNQDTGCLSTLEDIFKI